MVLRGVDMRAVIVAFGRLVTIKDAAADAAHQRARKFRPQLFTAGAPGVEVCTPVVITAPLVEGAGRQRGKDHRPGLLEGVSGGLECLGGSGAVLARLHLGIEAA